MVAPYTLIRKSGPNIGTGIFIPVTNPLERVNKESKRRTNVVGFVGKTAHHAVLRSSSLPNREAVIRLVGALMLEQNDEWAVSRRYMPVEAFAEIDTEEIDPIPSLSTQAA